jgi:uncharacterized protein
VVTVLALALALSVLIGVSLGLFGGGGSILTTPILLYALGLDAKEAIATSLVVVGITSAFGTAQRAAAQEVRWSMGLTFGLAGMVGAFFGGRVAEFIPERLLLGLFALLMLATAAGMFRGRRATAPAPARPAWQMVALGVLFGSITGLLGAGGGFLVVPALALFGGLPMREAVGTSLLVISLNCLAGYLGHAQHGGVDVTLAAGMSVASIMGSFLGGALASRVSPDALRRGFAVFVLALGCFVLVQQVLVPTA